MKKNKTSNFLLTTQSTFLIFILLFASSCGDDENVAPSEVNLMAPANSAVDVINLGAALTWQASVDHEGGAITYDVYIGTDASSLTVVSSGQAGATYTPTLEGNTTYYWKVAAKDPNGGTSTSSTWSFTTDLIAWSDATHGTFTDTRDGKVYKVVKIGSQTWFAENLNYVPTSESYWYNDFSANGDIYGGLYRFGTARDIIPSGWHLPIDDEWKTLELYLGMSQSQADQLGARGVDEGKMLKTAVGWTAGGNGTDAVGFSALPGGESDIFASWDLGKRGNWWSDTMNDSNSAFIRSLKYDSDKIIREIAFLMLANYSVRCVRD